MRKSLFTILSFLSAFCANGQGTDIPGQNEIQRMLNEQISLFPQEKIYLHTDRNEYIPGENIWFKAYLIDANDLLAPVQSRYVYVELIAPTDSVVSRVMLKPNEGLLHGIVSLPVDLGEGLYTLKAYTQYMNNQVNETLFRKPVSIRSLAGRNISPQYTFTKEGNKVYLELYYKDLAENRKIFPEKIKYLTDKGVFRDVRIDKDTIIRMDFNVRKQENRLAIYLEADTYKHYIPFNIPDEEYDVSFYPEGGNLLHGELCRVAFKVLTALGTSGNISGYIENARGEILVTDIRSVHKGMGIFDLNADKDETYYMVCRNDNGLERRFTLPKALPDACSVAADWRKDKLLVSWKKSADMNNDNPVYLLIHQNGNVISWQPCRSNSVLSIDKAEIPEGVVQLVLFDSGLNVLSERLVFCRGKKYSRVGWTTNNPTYKTREKVSINFQLKDEADKPLIGNLSLSVTDDKDIKPDSSMNIVSSLLLSSELRGYIEEPAFYFRRTLESEKYLDMVMRIHGWRRYNIPQVVRGVFEHPENLPETTISISGEVRNYFSSKPVKNGLVTFMFKNDHHKGIDFDQVSTDENGKFILDRIEIPDSVTVYIQSVNRKNNPNTTLIVHPQKFNAKFAEDRFPALRKDYSLTKNQDYLAKAEQRFKYDDNLRMIMLDEVEIVSRRIVKKESPYKSHYSSEFTTSLDMDDIQKANVTELINVFYQIPGVRVVSGQNGARHLVIRQNISLDGGKYAMVLVNGFEFDEERSFPSIYPGDVARIEVFKGSDAAIFGSKGSAGVVNIILKDGRDVADRKSENKIIYTPLGFQQPVEFYSPKYDTNEKKNSYVPDMRTTIYWKPDIITDENGNVRIEFYTSDETPTSYSAIIEGIASNGTFVRSVHQIKVE